MWRVLNQNLTARLFHIWSSANLDQCFTWSINLLAKVVLGKMIINIWFVRTNKVPRTWIWFYSLFTVEVFLSTSQWYDIMKWEKLMWRVRLIWCVGSCAAWAWNVNRLDAFGIAFPSWCLCFGWDCLLINPWFRLLLLIESFYIWFERSFGIVELDLSRKCTTVNIGPLLYSNINLTVWSEVSIKFENTNSILSLISVWRSYCIIRSSLTFWQSRSLTNKQIEKNFSEPNRTMYSM